MIWARVISSELLALFLLLKWDRVFNLGLVLERVTLSNIFGVQSDCENHQLVLVVESIVVYFWSLLHWCPG